MGIQFAFFYLVYLALPVGLVLLYFGFRIKKIWKKVLLIILAAVHIFPGLIIDKDVFFSRNHSQVDRAIVLEDWDAVSDGLHNSNTDLIDYKGELYLIHQASPFHLGTDKARLIVRKSTDDGRTWQQTAEIDGGDLDIRDPKFLVIGEKLFLYVLMNVELNPEPFTTLFTWSDNGSDWEALEETGHPEWLFWRARERDGIYYVPAYWYLHNKSILLTSGDGVNWERRSPIYEGGRNDETAIAFLASGEIISTARLEYSDSVFGHKDGSTLISRSLPPYETFDVLAEDQSNRLDGPRLFVWDDRVFAVGRYQPGETFLWQNMGSAFTRKRTSLFEVTRTGLKHLSDLPSTGDTSYAGLVFRGDEALICYYTSNVKRDFIWFTGLLSPSPIRMARIDLGAMILKADALSGQ